MILIFSKSFEESTNDIIDWLNFFQASFVRLNGNDFIESNKNFKFELSDKIELNYDGIDFNSIKTVWFRRWVQFNGLFNNLSEQIDELNISSMINLKENLITESQKAYRPIFDLITALDVKCVPQFKSISVNKYSVLKKAMEQGLLVPESIVCNNKEDIIAFKNSYGRIITKPLGEVVAVESESYIHTSKTVEITDVEIATLDTTFFPSFFQRYIEKEIEIRSFFLEDEFYSMAIFSQLDEKTSVDFRNYNKENPNRNVPFSLPDSLKEKLSKLMKSLNLNTGSIDLILTPEGKFYFLEVNPVGQFAMTSYPCNYYLEKRIVECLIK